MTKTKEQQLLDEIAHLREGVDILLDYIEAHTTALKWAAKDDDLYDSGR